MSCPCCLCRFYVGSQSSRSLNPKRLGSRATGSCLIELYCPHYTPFLCFLQFSYLRAVESTLTNDLVFNWLWLIQIKLLSDVILWAARASRLFVFFKNLNSTLVKAGYQWVIWALDSSYSLKKREMVINTAAIFQQAMAVCMVCTVEGRQTGTNT